MRIRHHCGKTETWCLYAPVAESALLTFLDRFRSLALVQHDQKTKSVSAT